MLRPRLVWMLTLALALVCLLALFAQASAATLGGFAWVDRDGDGVYQPGENPLRGVAVTLYCDGAASGSVKTGEDGRYAFAGLPAGSYHIVTQLPESYNYILPMTGGSAALPACGTQSRSVEFALAEDSIKEDMHIGARKASTYVKAFAFVDANSNGGRAVSEAPIKGMLTELLYEYEGQWIVIAAEKTDSEGVATYWDLTPGIYRLAVTLPEPYIVGPLGLKVNAWYNTVPPSDSNYGVTAPFDAPRSGSTGLGVGAVSTGSLSGKLWFDADCDGVRGDSEGGFAGATVRLENEQAGVSRTVQSDASGAYAFARLLAGEYTLTVTLPGGFMFTLPGGDSLMTQGYTDAQSAPVSVATDRDTPVQAVGVIPATALSVSVYSDLNANGLWDTGEPAFFGAQFAVSQQGEVRARAVSDSDGLAHIPLLRGGENTIACTLPEGQIFTILGQDSDFSHPMGASETSLTMDIPHGQHTALHAGVTLPASVSGLLFNDDNVSGVLDNNETGLRGFTVQAVDGDGQIVAETVTDINGAYVFPSLKPAPHAVRFLLTDAYVFSEYSDTAVATENRVIAQTAGFGQTAFVPLLPGQSVGRLDGGAFRSGTVSGAVHLLMEEGAQALGGLPGVKVLLLDEYGAPVGDTTTTYTDKNGNFYLKGALPGRYYLQYTLPDGMAFTSPLADGDTVVTDAFDIATYDDLTMPPLGGVYTGEVSGTLYHDANVNGVMDAGDYVLPDVEITLYSPSQDREYAASTLDNGQYIFSDLRPGAYTLSVTLPDGRCFAQDNTSFFAADAQDTASASFDLEMGRTLANRGIAAAFPAAFAGFVFFDMGNDNAFDAGDYAAAGVEMTLRAKSGAQVYRLICDADGKCYLPAIVPDDYTLLVTLPENCVPADGCDAALSNGLWVRQLSVTDGDSEKVEFAAIRYASITGAVWSMDGSLMGVAGRAVDLYHIDNMSQPLLSAITNEQGDFAFTQLKPGAYVLQSDLPAANYRFARKNDTAQRVSVILGDDLPDGALIAASDAFTLLMGQDLAGRDIGIGAVGKLGDTAWLDTNGNGMLDGGEPGVPGIEITLYQYGEAVASAVTDAYGHYLLEGLYPGAYTVTVTMHKELKTTLRQSVYPLVASVLPQSEDLTVSAEGVIVPSDGRNLNCDFGFVLRKADRYPDAMKNPPATDWRPDRD